MISITFFYCCDKVFTLMDDWGKFSEGSLSEKENFYSHLNMEEITDTDYTLRKRVCKDFEKKI